MINFDKKLPVIIEMLILDGMNRINRPERPIPEYVYPEKLTSLRDLPPVPIGCGQVEGWKMLPIHESSEPLVPLGPFSPHRTIYTSSIYFGEHNNSPYINSQQKLAGTLATVFVRESVASRLEVAQGMLPDGYRLVVFDSYRPLEVQSSLYEMFIDRLAQVHPEWSDEELTVETQKYVSLPSYDLSRPSPHNTGGAVDLGIFKLSEKDSLKVDNIDRALTEWLHPESDISYQLEMEKNAIIRMNGQFINFGTPFDHGGEMAAIDYYEAKEQSGMQLTTSEIQARDHRRLLYTVMTSVGMQPYGAEWWHFNAPESQMGAATSGKQGASFGAADLSLANREHELMRSMHHTGVGVVQESLARGETVYRNDDKTASQHLGLVAMVQRMYGENRISYLGRAERIDEALKKETHV